MTCAFCYHEFDAETARSGCGACPWSNGCRGVRCPACGYEMPEVPKTVERLAKLGAWARGLVSIGKRAPSPAHDGEDDGEHEAEDDRAADDDEVPLTALRAGQAGIVVRLVTNAAGPIQKLLAFGMLPGTSVLVRRRYPSFVVKLGFTELAMDEAMAAAVLVRRDGNGVGA